MDRASLAQLMTQQGRQSRNVEQAPTDWPAFMAEQMRNVPPLAGEGAVPPPLPGQLGQLSNAAGAGIDRTMAGTKGPQHPFARYVLNNPDEPPFDPTGIWDLQHR